MSTTTAVAVQDKKPSALAAMASRVSVDPDKLMSALKATVFKNASNEELLALVVVANEYGLNPFLKEVYAFPAKGGGIVPVISVDGWIKMVNQHPQMDGLDFEWGYTPTGELESCTAIYYRKDRSRPIRVTEYLSECKRNTEPWKMESRMLRHKALIQGARVAFGFSGIMDEDEAERITVHSEPTESIAAQVAATPAPRRAPRVIEAVNEEVKTEAAPTCDNDGRLQ